MPGQIRTQWVIGDEPQPPLRRLYGVLAYVAEDLTDARGSLVTRDDIIFRHGDKGYARRLSGWAKRAAALFNAVSRAAAKLLCFAWLDRSAPALSSYLSFSTLLALPPVQATPDQNEHIDSSKIRTPFRKGEVLVKCQVLPHAFPALSCSNPRTAL